MNWLERARRGILGQTGHHAADTAERNPTAVTAVPGLVQQQNHATSTGSIGSATISVIRNEAAYEDFEERAAVLEFDGGLDRDTAEQLAWAAIARRHRLH